MTVIGERQVLLVPSWRIKPEQVQNMYISIEESFLIEFESFVGQKIETFMKTYKSFQRAGIHL